MTITSDERKAIEKVIEKWQDDNSNYTCYVTDSVHKDQEMIVRNLIIEHGWKTVFNVMAPMSTKVADRTILYFESIHTRMMHPLN